jgi:uncharacterized RDD family membrane protein YckC
MFTIIGGDGKEYGPVSTDQIRGWINAGRANLDTKARAVGSEEWRRLGDYPEFAGPSEPPPLVPSTPPAGGGTGTAAATANLATFGQRFLGALIDGILKALCWMPAASLMMDEFGEQIRAGQQPTPIEMLDAMGVAFQKSLPFLAALAVVQCVLLTVRGQSVGKLVAGSRIVRYADNAKAGFLRAFLLRGTIPWVIEQIPIVGGLFWLVNVCFVFSEERRCVHDYIAGTKVVKAKP